MLSLVIGIAIVVVTLGGATFSMVQDATPVATDEIGTPCASLFASPITIGSPVASREAAPTTYIGCLSDASAPMGEQSGG